MKLRWSHAVLYVRDLDAMIAFYREVLNFNGYGMELFPEHGAREARVFAPKPESFDSSGAERDDRTAAVGEIEMFAMP